jgi:hypothetical protein
MALGSGGPAAALARVRRTALASGGRLVASATGAPHVRDALGHVLLMLKRWLPGSLASDRGPVEAGPTTSAVEAPPPRPRRAVPREYRSLHDYLDGRFATTVVLTFGQIEDLLGFALPDPARHQQEWWSNVEPPGPAPAPSRSWTEARRLATANLRAQIVVFERDPA